MAQRISEEGNLVTAEEALTVLTGSSHTNIWLLKNDFPVADPAPNNRADWVQFALANNYSLKAAVAAMQASDDNATAKTMEHMPKITGGVSYAEDHLHGDQDTTPPSPLVTPPGSESHSSAALVKVTVPLFSSGYTSSQARQANAQYIVALEKKVEIERNIVQETRAKHIAASSDVQARGD